MALLTVAATPASCSDAIAVSVIRANAPWRIAACWLRSACLIWTPICLSW
jgi:hypothetical protein